MSAAVSSPDALVPDSVWTAVVDQLNDVVGEDFSSWIPHMALHYLRNEYLAVYSTSDRTFVSMFQYLIQRAIHRLQSTSSSSSPSDTTDPVWRRMLVIAEPWEWNPTEWQHALRSDVSEQLVAVPADRGTPTDQFLCVKCGQRKCIFSTAQTRASDEGMTTFVTCLHCGKNWKM